jgi:alcohol dehydrogenase class IV
MVGDRSFRFEYDPPTIRLGRETAGTLESELEQLGVERALLVCGSTVGSTAAVMDPIREGVGDRLAGVFDETTPTKDLSTALAARRAYRRLDCDGIVGLGGGSSLDIAKAVATVVARSEAGETLLAEFAENGALSVPDTGVPAILAVPTTLAGAELSRVAGLTAERGSGVAEDRVSGGIAGAGLMPAGVCYDTDLLATTPRSVLSGSAMNGFDKGIETLYAEAATPVTDATASRGLDRFRVGLEAFGAGDTNPETFRALAEGVLLVQYGTSRTGGTTLSIIHAFGHGLTNGYGLQQGTAHAVIAPHVLEYVFDRVDGRRDLLAQALGVDGEGDPGPRVVEAVASVRDALDLPGRLREVDGPQPPAFDTVAEYIHADGMLPNGPPGLDPTVADIEEVLEAAW